MEDERKVAIARFVLRNKEHLAAIRPMDGVLTMATMRFADEVVPPDELDDVLARTRPKLDKREVEMAKQLIDSLATDFDPSKYRDEYREELLELIERKAEGEDIVGAPSEEPKPTKAPDLMAALEESLAAVRGEERAAAAKRQVRGEAQGEGEAEVVERPQELEDDQAARADRAAKAASNEVEVDGRALSG